MYVIITIIDFRSHHSTFVGVGSIPSRRIPRAIFDVHYDGVDSYCRMIAQLKLRFGAMSVYKCKSYDEECAAEASHNDLFLH